MSARGRLVSLIGATGAVGEEILRCLADREVPVLELRAFASPESEGREVEFAGELVKTEAVRAERVFGAAARRADAVLCAAPGVVESLAIEAREARTPLVDVSGGLELDRSVPLYLPGDPLPPPESPVLAIPRGVVAGLGLALRPLQPAAALSRLSIVTLESASGVGRGGVGELSEQTMTLLNSMTGEAGQAQAFPQPLAFDNLPEVGERLEDGQTSEERRLRHVLRRLLGEAALPIEVTRVRTPVFGGSLACVHAGFREELSVERARQLWDAAPLVEALPEAQLPTARSSVGTDVVQIGRVRRDGDGADGALSFVLALDELRRGAALGVVEAAEALFERA
jgi:aspartate-semialdehyde dehydrogenase